MPGEPAILFIIAAVVIFIVAIVATRFFGNSQSKDDLNGNKQDGDATAVWFGIDGGKD